MISHEAHEGREEGKGTEAIGREIVDAAIEVHRELGPGLLESVYEEVLASELGARGLRLVRQCAIPIRYKGRVLDQGFRADLIVESKVLIELKSVEALARLHRKQVLTYLKLSELHLGYLLNFNVPLMKDGIERLILGHIES